MPFAHVQSCHDDMHPVPLKVHINEGVPTEVEFVRPGETQDNYIPPDKTQVYQIRKAVKDAGALNICQKEGRLFATFSQASEISEQIYGQKIAVDDVDGRAYDNVLEQFRTAVSKPFFDPTLKYLHGEMEVEVYLAQTADASPSDITEASMYLFRTLWLDNFRAMPEEPYSYDEAEIQDRLENSDPYDSEDASQNWRHLAGAYMALHMTNEATAVSRWSVRLDPEDPNNWRVLAAAHHAHHQADPAKRKDALNAAAWAYAKVVELGGSIEDTVIPGEPSLTLDGDDPTTEAFQVAIETRLRLNTELEEKGGGVPSLLRKANDRLERFGKALRSAKEASKLLYGPGAWSLFTMGLDLLMLDKPDEAIEPLRQVLSLHPDWGDAWDSLGLALSWSDRLEDAIGAFKKAIEKGTRDTIGTRWRLAETMSKLYSRQGKRDFDMLSDVFIILFSIAQDQPDSTDTDLWLSLGRVSYGMSNFEPGFLEIAEFNYKKAAQLDRNNPEPWRIMARVYNLTGRPADTLHALKQELLALERMLVNGVEDEKAEAIEARIQELRDILGKTGMDDPEGGSGTPPASPAGSNGSPSPQGQGGGPPKKSANSVGGFHNNNDEILFITPSTSSTESAWVLYNYETSTMDPSTWDMETTFGYTDSVLDLSFQVLIEPTCIKPALAP